MSTGSSAEIVTVGATRRDLIVNLEDENGDPINLTGATETNNPKLQGVSKDTPAVTIDQDGTIEDAPNGQVKFSQIGGFVTQANLDAVSRRSSTYKLKVRFQDSLGLVDFTDEFEIIWEADPLTAL